MALDNIFNYASHRADPAVYLFLSSRFRVFKSNVSGAVYCHLSQQKVEWKFSLAINHRKPLFARPIFSSHRHRASEMEVKHQQEFWGTLERLRLHDEDVFPDERAARNWALGNVFFWTNATELRNCRKLRAKWKPVREKKSLSGAHLRPFQLRSCLASRQLFMWSDLIQLPLLIVAQLAGKFLFASLRARLFREAPKQFMALGFIRPQHWWPSERLSYDFHAFARLHLAALPFM